MLNENFVILAAVINSLGALRYLLDTIKGKVKPNKVTFLLWSLAPFIAFAAQLKQGVGLISLITFTAGFLSFSIFITSFLNKKAEWKIQRFDLVCGAFSILGLILWYLTKVGNVAILFGIAADGLAALPTIIKSYYYPETENGLAYLASVVGAAITILTIKNWTFAYYGFPLYIMIVCLIIFFLVQFKLGKIKT